MEKADIVFLQHMLCLGCTTIEKATKNYMEIVTKISELTEEESNGIPLDAININNIANRINQFIVKQDLNLTIVKCEANGSMHLALISLVTSPTDKLQNLYSKVDLKYFNSIMHEILISKERRLPMITLLNMANSLRPAVNLHDAEELIGYYVKLGYLHEEEGQLYLGPRCTAEFAYYIQSHYKEYIQICEFCSELVCFGFFCATCNKLMHLHCVQAFNDADNCPSCKQQTSQSSQSQSQRTSKRRRN